MGALRYIISGKRAGLLRLRTQELYLYAVEMARIVAEKEFGGSDPDKDEDVLARLGKKQVLKVQILQSRLITRAHLISETSALCPCSASAVR